MEETFTYDNMNRLTGITLTRPSGWLPGDGGNGDHPPGVPYLLIGVITIDLPEHGRTVITPMIEDGLNPGLIEYQSFK